MTLYERAMLLWAAHMLQLMGILIDKTGLSMRSKEEQHARDYVKQLAKISKMDDVE